MANLVDSVAEIIFRRDIELCTSLTFFKKIRRFHDGISNGLEAQFDFYRGDHNPQVRVALTILNVMIFELEVYNRYHNS
jgi:hypothetical protein